MIKTLAHRLGGDRSGATMVEFAIITPVMLTVIMGLSELAYQGYVQAVLTGAVQKAGRDSAIQKVGTQTDQIDAAVMKQVWSVAKNATYVNPPSRESFSSFATVGPEPFTDSNGNGQYDAATECFTDTNGNKVWDADPGTSGQGGANDVVVYSITIQYNRLFPVFSLIGMSNQAQLTGSTTLKNQPWASQLAFTPTQVCPT